MQQYELNGKTILVSSLPANAWGFQVFNDPGMPYLFFREKEASGGRYYLPDGNWRFIATTDTITEEHAVDIVDGEYVGYGIVSHPDYETEDKDFNFFCPLQSFHSWLTANGITGNHAILLKMP